MPRVRVAARRKAVARAPVVEADCANAESASRPRVEIESARRVGRMCVEKFNPRRVKCSESFPGRAFLGANPGKLPKNGLCRR